MKNRTNKELLDEIKKIIENKIERVAVVDKILKEIDVLEVKENILREKIIEKQKNNGFR